MKTQREHENKLIEADRQGFEHNEIEQRTRGQEELKAEQTNTNKLLGDTRGEAKVEIEGARNKGTKDLDKMRLYYDKNLKKIHRAGEEKIQIGEEDMQHKLDVLDKESKAKLEQMKAAHHEEMEHNEELYKKEEVLGQNFYKDSLLQQRKGYEIAYRKNIKDFEDTVRAQREILGDTLARQKKSVTQNLGKYNNRSADPFYRISEPQANLRETDAHYFVQAQIPEHEKDNVHVIVHPDKVVVAGNRRFEDEVDDESGKMATHSYQTYRQEIPLEHPVREKYAQTSYENGVLTVKIPKA